MKEMQNRVEKQIGIKWFRPVVKLYDVLIGTKKRMIRIT